MKHFLASLSLAVCLTGCLSYHAGALPNEPEATYAEVRGARIRYVEKGEGPAVVMIHGFASGLHTWAKIIPELEGDHHVLALDLKGFGWSDRPEGDYSPAEQARIVLALMDARGIERAAIVGHSYGASVALALALEAPERVERIALYDAWVYDAQLPTFFYMSRAGGVGEALFALYYDQRPEDRMALAFYDPTIIEQDFVDHAIAQLERPGTKAAALAAVRAMRYEEPEARYGEIVQPVLLLWGEEDIVTPLHYAHRLYEQLPHAELRTYPECGHFPMIEAANPSTDALVAFLRPRVEEVVAVEEAGGAEGTDPAAEQPQGAEGAGGGRGAPQNNEEASPSEASEESEAARDSAGTRDGGRSGEAARAPRNQALDSPDTNRDQETGVIP